jgi:hypothetical protein
VASPNYNLRHRPLRGGVAIFNPVVDEIGSVGFIGIDSAGARWLVSCYHVLCRPDLSPSSAEEDIFQPIDDQANLIARTSADRRSINLDCAAARVLDGVEACGEILGIPKVAGIEEPAVGMRLLKAGCVSGITEGLVTAIAGDLVEITLCTGHPADSVLCEPGDSGALWINRENVKAVALHQEGTRSGGLKAKARRLSRVANELRLTPLFE